MAKYERANTKSGRLFPASKEDMERNPKRPVLNGTIVIDGVACYLGLWKRTSKKGTTYFTAELTYPEDETARIKATGPATSAVAKKEAEYDAEHPQSTRHDKSRWDSRAGGGKPADDDNGGDIPDDEGLPF